MSVVVLRFTGCVMMQFRDMDSVEQVLGQAVPVAWAVTGTVGNDCWLRARWHRLCVLHFGPYIRVASCRLAVQAGWKEGRSGRWPCLPKNWGVRLWHVGAARDLPGHLDLRVDRITTRGSPDHHSVVGLDLQATLRAGCETCSQVCLLLSFFLGSVLFSPLV